MREELKESRKTRYTRRAIKEAFNELLRKKPLNEITVKELAETADINRSTFYAHYETIDQLVINIETENAKKILQSFNATDYNDREFIYKTINSIFGYLLNDTEAAYWFLDQNVTGVGRSMVHDYAEEKFIPLWMNNKSISEIDAKYSFEYLYDGCIGILTRWYNNKSEISENDLFRVFYKLAETTLQLLH